MPRAASATFMPAPAKARAIEALRPEPAPTINASCFSFAMMQFPSQETGAETDARARGCTVGRTDEVSR